MYSLESIGGWNWHTFSPFQVSVSGNTAILGPNTSGKSTLLDLAQIVLTGGKPSFFRLNATAAEDGVKQQRSVGGYVLAQLNRETVLRQSAVSVIYLVFKDPDLELPDVTIGLVLDAVVDEVLTKSGSQMKANIVTRFISTGRGLELEQLKDEGSTEKSWLLKDWPTLRDDLEDAGNTTIMCETATEFVQEYMRLLGSNSYLPDDEVTQLLKTLVVGLQMKSTKSPNQFVRNHLLEPDNIDLTGLRTSILAFREMADTIAQLEEDLVSLKKLDVLIDNYQSAFEDFKAAEGAVELGNYLESKTKNVDTKRRITASSTQISRENKEIERLQRNLESEKATAKELSRQISQSSEAQRIAIAEETKEKHALRSDALRRELLTYRSDLQKITATCNEPDELAAYPRFTEQIVALTTALETENLKAWPKDPAWLDTIVDSLIEMSPTVLTAVTRLHSEAAGEYQQSKVALEATEAAIGTAKAGNVAASTGTQNLVDDLQKTGIETRLLFQEVEVRLEKWLPSAEAILGKDREAIFVAREDLDRAKDVLKKNRNRYRGAKIANTRKIDAADHTAKQGTLASVLSASDPLVMAYIVRRIGNVRLCAKEKEIYLPGRAVFQTETVEGVNVTYDDGLSFGNRNVNDRKLGQGAAASELNRQQALFAHYRRLFVENGRALEKLNRILIGLNRLSDVASREKTIAEIALAIDLSDEQVGEQEATIADLRNSLDPGLKVRLDQCDVRISEYEEDLIIKRGQVEGANERIKLLKRDIEAGENFPGSDESVKFHRSFRFRRSDEESSARWSTVIAYSLRSYMKEYRKQRVRAGNSKNTFFDFDIHKLVSRQFDRDLATYLDLAKGEERTCRIEIGKFFQQSGQPNRFAHDAPLLGEIRPWIRDEVTRIEDSELAKRKTLAKKVSKEAKRMFQSTFVAELRRRLGDARRKIRVVNEGLDSRVLHNERYCVHCNIAADRTALVSLADAVANDDTVIEPLFADTIPPEHPYADALTKVRALLINSDIDPEEWEDYRGYFEFDLSMTDIESGNRSFYRDRITTASGAEFQTPFYVVMGAALSSIYHGRKRENTEYRGIGLAIFDEAFSKLDGPNQRELLSYFDSLGLQTVVAGPSEKRPVIRQSMGCILDVSRPNNKVSRVRSTRLKLRAREALKEILPEHQLKQKIADMVSEQEEQNGVAKDPTNIQSSGLISEETQKHNGEDSPEIR